VEYSTYFKNLQLFHRCLNAVTTGIANEAMAVFIENIFLNNLIPNQSFIRWETQHGCPFACSFCQHRESSNLTRRHFEFTRIAREIQWICRPKSNVRDLNLVDPTFNSGPNYLNVLNELIRHKYSGKVALQTIHRNEQIFIDRLLLSKSCQSYSCISINALAWHSFV